MRNRRRRRTSFQGAGSSWLNFLYGAALLAMTITLPVLGVFALDLWGYPVLETIDRGIDFVLGSDDAAGPLDFERPPVATAVPRPASAPAAAPTAAPAPEATVIHTDSGEEIRITVDNGMFEPKVWDIVPTVEGGDQGAVGADRGAVGADQGADQAAAAAGRRRPGPESTESSGVHGMFDSAADGVRQAAGGDTDATDDTDETDAAGGFLGVDPRWETENYSAEFVQGCADAAASGRRQHPDCEDALNELGGGR